MNSIVAQVVSALTFLHSLGHVRTIGTAILAQPLLARNRHHVARFSLLVVIPYFENISVWIVEIHRTNGLALRPKHILSPGPNFHPVLHQLC